MNYNINNYPWGYYFVNAKKSGIKATSNKVGVNMVELQNTNFSVIKGENNVPIFNLDCKIFAHWVETTSGSATVNVYSGLEKTDENLLGSFYSNRSPDIIIDWANKTLTVTLNVPINLITDTLITFRYITLNIKDGRYLDEDIVIDLQSVTPLIINATFNQTTNGGSLVLNLDYIPSRLSQVKIKYVNSESGVSTQTDYDISSAILLVGTQNTTPNDSTFEVVEYKFSNSDLNNLPVYLQVNYTPTSIYHYVKMETPVLSYNAELNQLEWDSIVGAQEYEVVRNDIVIATLDENGEVKTS